MGGFAASHRISPPEHDRTTVAPIAAASRAAPRLISKRSVRAQDVMSRGMCCAPPHSRYRPCSIAKARMASNDEASNRPCHSGARPENDTPSARWAKAHSSVSSGDNPSGNSP